jgi:hypothetical protein
MSLGVTTVTPGIGLSQVFDFLDNAEELPGHIVMFYEEPELAMTVALRFLKSGLEKGERCKYDVPNEQGSFADVEHAKAFVEQEMQDNGIDTAYYKRKGLLQLYSFRDDNIVDLDSYRKSIEKTRSTLQKQFGSESNYPRWRRIGRAITNIKTDSGMASELQIENYFQNDAYAKVISQNGILICTYQVDDIVTALEKKEHGINELLQAHDAAIYLLKNGNGLAFRLR